MSKKQTIKTMWGQVRKEVDLEDLVFEDAGKGLARFLASKTPGVSRRLGAGVVEIGVVMDHEKTASAFLEGFSDSLKKESEFKSKAQRRKFYAMEERGEISKKTLNEWEKETPKGKKLPERVKKSSVQELKMEELRNAVRDSLLRRV